LNNRVKSQPPWDFLLSASRVSLQSFELSRLSHAANIRKEIVQLLDVWLEESSAAMMARFLLEQHQVLASRDIGIRGGELGAKPPRSVSDNFLANQGIPAPRIRTAS
jgi:hypothetical protein